MAARSLVERLSSLDRAFLDVEDASLHMHVGAVAVFDGDGLVSADGALDAAAVRDALDASVSQVPRFRQRVHVLPLLGAVWMDDADFRIDHHVIHTSVPRPGTRAQLDELAGRLFSQPLDRTRPLWEMWLVEGLERGRFALVAKAHHSMLDGVEGVGVLGALFSLAPRPIREGTAARVPGAEAKRFSRADLARALFDQRVSDLPRTGARLRDFTTGSGRARIRSAIGGGLQVMREVYAKSPVTALNPACVGPYRAFGGRRLSIDRLKAVRRASGVTLNDVALAIVTGMLRRHLVRHGTDVNEMHLRALVPVNLRTRETRSAAARTGNHVSMMIVSLPIGEADPRRRLELVHAHSKALKEGSHEIEAAQLLEELGDLGPDRLMTLVFGIALRLLAFHVVVTNVAGPPVPLYLGPAKLESLHPLVPLFARQALAIAMVSYDGGLFFGVNADRDAVPDLEAVLDDLAASEDELVVAILGAGGEEASRSA